MCVQVGHRAVQELRVGEGHVHAVEGVPRIAAVTADGDARAGKHGFLVGLEAEVSRVEVGEGGPQEVSERWEAGERERGGGACFSV